MVEVDVHTLELEVGGSIVPSNILETRSTCSRNNGNLLSIAIETVLARDSLPLSQLARCQLMPEMAGEKVPDVVTYQKAAPIWLPYSGPI